MRVVLISDDMFKPYRSISVSGLSKWNARRVLSFFSAHIFRKRADEMSHSFVVKFFVSNFEADVRFPCFGCTSAWIIVRRQVGQFAGSPGPYTSLNSTALASAEYFHQLLLYSEINCSVVMVGKNARENNFFRTRQTVPCRKFLD